MEQFITEAREDDVERFRTHLGPTDSDPDPGKRWHYDCGGEVLTFKEGSICSECNQQGEPY
jgi:hypothetical protein